MHVEDEIIEGTSTKKDKLFWWAMGIISFLFCTVIIGWVSGVESRLNGVDKLVTQVAIIDTKLDGIKQTVDKIQLDFDKHKEEKVGKK